MKLRTKHLFWILPLFLLFVFGLLSMAASAWLESSGGRQLVQNALGNSLGFPVQLAGDYRLKLFPRIRFTGTQLHMEHVRGDAPFAGSEEFTAVIELMPFLRKDIRITSLRLSKGFLDLPRLSGAAKPAGSPGTSEITLPSVGLVQLDDFRVILDESGRQLHLGSLQLEDFVPGEQARLGFEVSLRDEEEQLASLSAKSRIRLEPGDLSVRVDVEQLGFAWGEISATGLQGELEWDASSRRLLADLHGPAGSQASFRLDLSLSPTPAGIIEAEYYHPQTALPSRIRLRFVQEGDAVGLEFQQLELAGQVITGKGCIGLAEKPVLNLMLESEELDLDKLYSLVPETEGESSELAVEPAIHIQVGAARFSGAEATGVDVLIGGAPDCSLLSFPLPPR